MTDKPTPQGQLVTEIVRVYAQTHTLTSIAKMASAALYQTIKLHKGEKPDAD